MAVLVIALDATQNYAPLLTCMQCLLKYRIIPRSGVGWSDFVLKSWCPIEHKMSKRKRSSNKQASPARSGVSLPGALPLRLWQGSNNRPCRLLCLLSFCKWRIHIGRQRASDEKRSYRDPRTACTNFGAPAEADDYWPVTNTSFWIEWRLWGMNPTGYHVTNLILHIVEALLIWIILRKLSIPGAFLAAIDLRRASGERGVGGLDRAAEKHDGDVVLPVVDSVVFESCMPTASVRIDNPQFSDRCERDNTYSSFMPSSVHPFTSGTG